MYIIPSTDSYKNYAKQSSALLLILVIINLSLLGQSKKPIFQSLQQGLSHQLVKCILKDSKGFMWFGTMDGLNKFDGANFTVYENSSLDTASISHNTINSIIEDKQNNIWIGTADGINLYNRDKNNFTRIKVPRYNYLYINNLCLDNKGNLWIGSIGVGVIFYDPVNHKFDFYSHNDNNSGSIASDYVTGILFDKKNNMWVGTRNGLDLFDKNKKRFRHFVHNPFNPNSLSNNLVSSLILDSKGNVWIGTLGGGLNKILKEKDRLIFNHYQHTDKTGGLSHNSILSLCEDQKGNLWIGTENGGLDYFNMKTKKLDVYQAEEGNPNSLSSNSIWSLYRDNTDILWIGTYNRGINIIDNKYKKFELFQRNTIVKNTLSNNDVTRFAEDNRENLWVATDGGGVCCFNTKTRQFTNVIKNSNDKKILSNNSIETILCDFKENLWLGTWTGGIDRLNKYGKKVKNYKVEGRQGTGDNNIMSLYEDKSKNIWAGTAGSGLFLYNSDRDEFIKVTDETGSTQILNTAYVTSILEDANNNLWVATLWGLVSMKRKNNGSFSFSSFFHNNNKKSISSNRITIIFEDSKKRLWFGTEDKGLNLLNKEDNSFINFQKTDGLPNNSIKGILEDNKGNLWISTNKGISKFNPVAKTFTNYTKDDGLNSDVFYSNSCFRSHTGEFFFGGNNGFNAFYPDSIKNNTLIPPIYFTDLKIFNKSVQVGGEESPLKKHINLTHKIILSYKQNSFTIEFVALNYTRSSQNQYAYMLEGLENEWNNIGHKHAATYTNINPGTYVFKVMGSNNDGIWNKTPTTLEITILPPFWKTIWAYILYILVFALLFFVIIRLMVIRAKQLHLLELDQMKLHFFANISHELRTPLTLILSPLENLVSSAKIETELKSQLTTIYRNAGRLFRLVNELMDFTKTEENELHISVQSGDIVKFTKEIFEFYNDEAQRRQIDYHFIAEDKIEAWFDRDKIEKVILNLLSNAFKFTSDQGKIVVKVETIVSRDNKYEPSKEYVKISITDNGLGISQKYIDKVFDRFFQSPDDKGLSQSGTGIGLALSKNLVELHHGKITVTSEKSKETCFSVFLPLGNSHFNTNEIFAAPLDISTNASITSKEEINLIPPKNAPSVLIIEDNFELRQYIVSHLSGKYKLLEAENGEEGYSIAIREIPDLIVSDIIMSKMSGIELCKKVKEEIATSHIPVVLLTAKINLEEKIEGIQTGADAYITKPFNIRFLDATVKNLIETRLKLFQRFSQEVFIMPKEFSNNPLDQNFLERTIEFIEKNILNEELTVEDLASHLLLSHSQTYRKIKALTGQSVNELIRTIRLKMAIKLMDTGKYNISEIAFKVGFASPAYFTKCFRQQFGKPPSEYFSDFNNKNVN